MCRMPYLLKRDNPDLERRWLFKDPEGFSWFLFLSDAPDACDLDEIVLHSEHDPAAVETYEVTDVEAQHLINTFTHGAKESDLLAWLGSRAGAPSVGSAIDACAKIIEGFTPRQTNTILCALLAHFGTD